ncbi:hypothetical protein CCP2SC5_2310002 [Azospirillaceae bacterium]
MVAAKQAGVNNYIVKPFNADTLRQKIQAVLGVTRWIFPQLTDDEFDHIEETIARTARGEPFAALLSTNDGRRHLGSSRHAPGVSRLLEAALFPNSSASRPRRGPAS